MEEWVSEADPEIDFGLSKTFYKAFGRIWYETAQQHLDECLEQFVQLRRDLGSHKLDLAVSVARAICGDCVSSWHSYFPELQEPDLPDIYHEGWTVDLLLLGFPPAVIDDLEEAIAKGVDASVQGPYCFDCGRPLPYWEDEDSACYVVKEPLEDYIGRRFETDAVSVGKSLRKAVVKVYGPNCFGCNKLLKGSEVTIDHIVPKAKGGGAEIFNLQPLCKACNEEKADHPPVRKDITLHFPLRPRPSEAYEGWSW